MESVKTNESELTSTMGNLMSTSKTDKTDASDSTPTSSTDAFTTTSTSDIAADDPISSTSSDILDSKKCTEKVTVVAQSSTNVMSTVMNPLKDFSSSVHSSPIVSEKDLLVMNITDTSMEKITENVDDIVQDLENLLGEPTASFDFTIRSRDFRNSSTVSQDKDIAMDLDAFSAELQMLSEQSSDSKEIPKVAIKKSVDTEPMRNHIKEDSKIESILTDTIENKSDKITTDSQEKTVVEKISEPVSVEQSVSVEDVPTKVEENIIEENIAKECVQEIESSHPDTDDINSKDEQSIDCQSEIISASEKNQSMVLEEIPPVLPKTEALDETQGNFISEISKESEVKEVNASASENVQEISGSKLLEVEETQKIDKTEEKKTDLITSAVTNDVSIKETPDTVCEELTKQAEKTVIELKNQEVVGGEEGFLIVKEQCDASEDVNNLSVVVPEELKHVQEIQHSECSEKMDENQVIDTLTKEPTEVKESLKSLESQKPESSRTTENQTDVQGKESLVASETPALVEKCESVKKTSDELEIIETIEGQDRPTNEVSETEEIKSELAAPVANETETATEVDISIVKETEIEKMEVVNADNLIDEYRKSSAELSQMSSETVDQTRSVCSTNVEARNIQEITDSDLHEKCASGSLSEPEEIPSTAQIIDEPKLDLEVIEEKSETNDKNNEESEPGSAAGNTEISELQTDFVEQLKTSEIDEIQSCVPIEECKSPKENIQIPVEMTDIGESIPDVTPLDFIPENTEMSTHSLTEDLDLLVQNTINESISSAVSSIEEKPEETSLHIPSSTSIDSLKDLDIVENNILPLAVEVPDLEVLNAISTLSDNPSSPQNITQSDALLSSSSLQPSTDDVPFDVNIDTALPTVDEIFSEQTQQQIDVQDENLETLLAVASLQNVDYNIPTTEDFTSTIGEMSSFVPEDSFISQEVASTEKNETEQERIVAPVEFPNIVDATMVHKDTVSGEEVTADIGNSELKEVAQKQENNLKEPLVINVEDNDKERVYSPKITIKPIKPPEEEETVTSGSGDVECLKGSLKMTITKQSDNTHSILKIYDPDHDNTHQDEAHPEPSVPKLIIKPIVQPNEQPQSPKMSTRSSKVFSPTSSTNQRSASPRITIKPIPKPDEPVAPLKITIKPVLKSDDSHKQKHSPKLTIKTLIKPEEEGNVEPKMHSPRVTIKPIVKPLEEVEQVVSPRITIKPIVKPVEVQEQTTPRLTIKPVVKPSEKEKNVEIVETVERSSPKITIKPIVKPQETESLPAEDFEESIKERIVLKINKGTIPGNSKESRKRDIPVEEEKSEKLPKMKLKFSKGGGHPQIVQDQSPTKRSNEQSDHEKTKRQRTETEHFLPALTITTISPSGHSKLKEMLSRGNDNTHDRVMAIDDDEVTLVEEPNKPSPIVISEESNQDSMASSAVDLRDPISEIPVFEITPDSVKTINPQPVAAAVEVPPVVAPAPRKRGRPRKVPLQVREDFKDPKEEEPKPVIVESTRPKRSCRGQSVRTTLGIKPRKPRGPGRGRGSKRGMGTRSTPTPPETPPRAAKEPKLGGTKLKELKEESFLLSDKSEVKTIEIDDGLQKSPSNTLLAPPQSDTSTTDRADIVMYEEETRMSAETSSRAQTPAKQVVTSIPTVDLVEESQSSVQSIQSTATTESVKVRRGPRLEVHQEPEGAVISADQLAEYFWSGGGPFMLQEQVAQFLGIKSFKRKYPNIARRVVDMQERDFIRESGLAGEAMCDLGLTAVNSSDILDIMYSDFQDKYEEYCKHQRDRQAKDLINKQKALSLAASQEKAKLDITQQAVQSAASWNANFNKARRDQRKSCMDLQTLTIHFPKGKMKQISKPKIGYYPVALVPGQYTDYYKEFSPTEVNNLPLSTLCYEPVIRSSLQEMECDSQTDGSGSDSDSSSSDTDSSYSGSSDGEDCTLCKPTPKRVAAAL